MIYKEAVFLENSASLLKPRQKKNVASVHKPELALRHEIHRECILAALTISPNTLLESQPL